MSEVDVKYATSFVKFVVETEDDHRVISFYAKISKMGKGYGILIPKEFRHLFAHRERVLIILSPPPMISQIEKFREVQEKND